MERLQVLAGHLTQGQGEQVQGSGAHSAEGSVSMNPTAGSPGVDGYTVILPEKLSPDGEWTVRR